eukprot:5903621-Alexandrium_andersonii.AAC.1
MPRRHQHASVVHAYPVFQILTPLCSATRCAASYAASGPAPWAAKKTVSLFRGVYCLAAP